MLNSREKSHKHAKLSINQHRNPSNRKEKKKNTKEPNTTLSIKIMYRVRNCSYTLSTKLSSISCKVHSFLKQKAEKGKEKIITSNKEEKKSTDPSCFNRKKEKKENKIQQKHLSNQSQKKKTSKEKEGKRRGMQRIYNYTKPVTNVEVGGIAPAGVVDVRSPTQLVPHHVDPLHPRPARRRRPGGEGQRRRQQEQEGGAPAAPTRHCRPSKQTHTTSGSEEGRRVLELRCLVFYYQILERERERGERESREGVC